MAPFTFITELPAHISPAEHKNIVASTPSSFASIPPVLRHKEENVSVTIDPPLEGFPAEDLTSGTLYVIERYVCRARGLVATLTGKESALVYISASGRGWSVDYPSITLHAISRAESGPSIYCQLDEAAALADSEAPLDEDADTEMKELMIMPREAAARKPILPSRRLWDYC